MDTKLLEQLNVAVRTMKKESFNVPYFCRPPSARAPSVTTATCAEGVEKDHGDAESTIVDASKPGADGAKGDVVGATDTAPKISKSFVSMVRIRRLFWWDSRWKQCIGKFFVMALLLFFFPPKWCFQSVVGAAGAASTAVTFSYRRWAILSLAFTVALVSTEWICCPLGFGK